jgi:hypothetical protein
LKARATGKGFQKSNNVSLLHFFIFTLMLTNTTVETLELFW